MSTPRKKRDEKPAVPVVRREPESRKRLPPELEAFARSEGMRLPRTQRPSTPKLNDPRESGLIPGVGNRDARLVADARITELGPLVETRTEPGNEAALEQALAEATALGLWRGRSVTGFDAMAEHVVGLDPAEALALAERGRQTLGLPEGLANEALVAIWMRTEAALGERGFNGRATMARDAQGRDQIVVKLSVAHAPEGFEAIGRRMTPLVRDKRETVAAARESRDRQRGERGPRDRDR